MNADGLNDFVDQAEAADDPLALATALSRFAGQALHAGRLNEGLAACERAFVLVRRGLPLQLELALCVSASALLGRMGERPAALAMCQRALAIVERVPDIDPLQQLQVAHQHAMLVMQEAEERLRDGLPPDLPGCRQALAGLQPQLAAAADPHRAVLLAAAADAAARLHALLGAPDAGLALVLRVRTLLGGLLLAPGLAQETELLLALAETGARLAAGDVPGARALLLRQAAPAEHGSTHGAWVLHQQLANRVHAASGDWQSAFDAQQHLHQDMLRRHRGDGAAHPHLAARAPYRGHAQVLQQLSHDLRSSLTAIVLTLHTEADQPLAAVERLALAALAATDRAVDEATPLLGAWPAPQPVDLLALACDALQRFQATAQQRQVRLALQHAGPAWVLGACDPLASCLDKLMDNALRVAPPGSDVGTSLQPVSTGGWCLSVRDGGPGFAPDVLPRLFEPLPPGPQGRGMGLALVAHTVERLGGRVRAEQALPQGARVELWLPGAQAPAVATGLRAGAGPR